MAENQASPTANEEHALGANVEGCSPLFIRRSGRARKRPSTYSDDADHQEEHPVAPTSPAEPRRNTKRRATPETFDVPNNLLEASLAPWEKDELAGWAGWVELESDPAFFSAVLGRLGVKGAKIEELLSVDEDFLATLPAPVYGLVFLYDYAKEKEPDVEEDSTDVWFANQTTNNACATIALLNIIMNAEDLPLGEKLRQLKQESMDLSPPLRGDMITNSTWIRTAHNSFARRLDLLNATLALQNEVDKKKQKRAKISAAKQKKAAKREKARGANAEGGAAYHFIAFVPIGQKVWQLDGLVSVPVCIGDFTKDQHWTSIVRPVLEERMRRYESGQLHFSLLALCGDNLADVRQKLAANIRSLETIDTRSHGDLEGSPKADPDIICSSEDSRISTYQLDAEDIRRVPGNGDEDTKLAAPSQEDVESAEPADDPTARLKLWEKLGAEQKLLREQYEVEAAAGQDLSRIFGRTKDHTPAIHQWVKRLAEHSVLKKLNEEVQLYNAA